MFLLKNKKFHDMTFDLKKVTQNAHTKFTLDDIKKFP